MTFYSFSTQTDKEKGQKRVKNENPAFFNVSPNSKRLGQQPSGSFEKGIPFNELGLHLDILIDPSTNPL